MGLSPATRTLPNYPEKKKKKREILTGHKTKGVYKTRDHKHATTFKTRP
jgi:hypothetical protein